MIKKISLISLAKLVRKILLVLCQSFVVLSPKNPTVKAVKAKIEAEEEKFDFSILDSVVEKC